MKNNIDIFELFMDCMKDNTKEPIERFENAIKTVTIEKLKLLPLEVRVNYILNSIIKSGLTDKDIDWDKLNLLIFQSLSPYDYTLQNKPKGTKELQDLAAEIILAEHGLCPWIRTVCKECGKEFEMTKSKTESYKNRGLAVPKRCPECIDKRKVAKHYNDGVPTSMQRALINAGLININ